MCVCIHTTTTLHPGLRLINWAYNPGMIPPFLDTLQMKQNTLSNLRVKFDKWPETHPGTDW